MFYLPVRIIFGTNAVRKSFVFINRLGKRALLVTSKHAAKASGALDDVQNLFADLNIDYYIYDQVEENPVLETITTGAAVFGEQNCDFVIGIGGGSPLDAAKAISLAAANHLDQSTLYDLAKIKKSFPVVAIPTTAGTGSEVTQYSVLTNTETKVKAGFGHECAFPVLALDDAKYTLSLSPKTTLYTAVDALSHLLEGLYSKQRLPMIYPLIFQGVKLILDNLKPVLEHPNDLQKRENLLLASLYGGMAIAHTSTTFQHSIGYPLTAEFGLPHGLTNGLVLKPIMNLYYPSVKNELDALFAYLKTDKASFFNWLDSLELSAGIKITPEFVAAKTPEILSSRNMANNPISVTAEDIAAVLQNIN